LILTNWEENPKEMTMTKSFNLYTNLECNFSFGEKNPEKPVNDPTVLNDSVAFPHTLQQL
jgi:hypothetical protein